MNYYGKHQNKWWSIPRWTISTQFWRLTPWCGGLWRALRLKGKIGQSNIFVKMCDNIFVIEISDNIKVILAKEIFVFKMCDKIDFYLSWPKNLVYSKCATILILSLWLGLGVHFYQCIIYPLEVHSCPILGRISWTVYRLAFLTKKSRMPSKQSIFMRTLSMELEY